VNQKETVIIGRTGYETFSDAAERHYEERQNFRNRILRGLRGHLRENGGVRWRVAWLLAQSMLVSGLVVGAFHSAGVLGSQWHPCLVLIAGWPLFALGFIADAKKRTQRLDLFEKWTPSLLRDELGEIRDRLTSKRISEKVDLVWNSAARQSGQNNGGGVIVIILLILLTAGTWLVWDLLRRAPALMAEVILDGIIAPAHPEMLQGR